MNTQKDFDQNVMNTSKKYATLRTYNESKKISSRSHAIGSQETFNYLRSGCIDLEMKDSMERVVQQE